MEVGYIEMKGIKPEYVWTAAKTIRVRSRVKRKNHMDIICHAEDEETQEIIRREMRKAVQRMNCLSKSKISFNEVIILEKDG